MIKVLSIFIAILALLFYSREEQYSLKTLYQPWQPSKDTRVQEVLDMLVQGPLEQEKRQWATLLSQAIRFRTVSSKEGSSHSHCTGIHDDAPQVKENNSPPVVPKAALDELERMREWMKEAFPLVHKNTKLEIVNGHTLLYKWTGAAEERAVMLCAHLDVVPIDGHTVTSWTHEPFSGTIDGGFIWGRGALDFKNGVIGWLAAVEYVLQHLPEFKPPVNIYLAFGHDEEIMGHNGAKQLARLLSERGVILDFILDEGTPITVEAFSFLHPAQQIALVSIAEKGFLNLDLRIRSSGGHSSMPLPQGTILSQLARAITAIDENPVPFVVEGSPGELMLRHIASFASSTILKAFVKVSWLLDVFPSLMNLLSVKSPLLINFFRTTHTVSIIQGGTAKNVLPYSAQASINFRIAPGSTVQDVVSHVQAILVKKGLMDASAPFCTKTTSSDKICFEEVSEFNAIDPIPASNMSDWSYDFLARTISSFSNALTTQRASYSHEDPPRDIHVVPSLMIAATDTKYYTNLTGQIYRFTPLVLRQSDIVRIHGVDERIGIDDFALYVQFFISVLLRLK